MRASDAERDQSARTPDPARAVILDMDGTLIDSEPLYRLVDEQFAASRGISVPPEEWSHMVGIAGREFIDMLRERHGLTGDTAELLEEKDCAYLEYVRGRIRAFAPMRELILAILLRGVPLALATSSRRSVLDSMLAETGLTHVFKATVSADDVTRLKPAPDAFLLAARRLGVPPEECWVIEDSQYGVQAARRAGMRVVGVPAAGHEEMTAFSEADCVVAGGAAEVNPADLLRAFGLRVRDDRVAAGTTIADFHALISDHYRTRGRFLPWRETHDPYAILVSELMLQQTQADRVVDKYTSFLAAFPTVAELAKAPLGDVLAAWQGLGYNRRGKYLHDAAKRIVSTYEGRVPSSVADLRTLPGVGPYTAGAVAAFAFNVPAVFVETNIRRVFIQLFFAGRDAVADREILPLVSATVDCDDPRTWYYALMDYGVYLARLYGNANRRSSHYTRQSRFSGSVREVRGGIIRLLSENGPTSRDELERRVAPYDERFPRALASLEQEGMVVCEAGTVRLP